MTLIDHDLGTPAPRGASRDAKIADVTLTIDGESVVVPEGTSVMRAAALAGVDVPKLCATDKLDPFGSCRLCLVEIDGRKGTPASCTTPVAPGMSVTTQSPKLERLRRGVMELYISDHPLDCLTCAANGDCELQDMAGAVGLRDVRYGYEGDNHLSLTKDTSNPYFTFDSSKCIVCSQRSETKASSRRPSVTITWARELMTATFVPGRNCRKCEASTCGVRTRSI